MKFEIRKKWLWVGLGMYIAYTVAMILPFFAYMYSMAVLGSSTITADYGQVQAMELLAIIWFISSLVLWSVVLFLSQFFTVR